MFDRLLCRFYKHWDKSNPNAIIGFAKTHGVKEYDRDVLKHDWKRWCLRGLNGVKMTESEVIDGITLEQNIGSLARNPTTGRWELNGVPLVHVTTKSDPDCLTEFSSLSSLSSDGEGEEEEEEEEETDVEQRTGRLKRALQPPRRMQAQRQEEEEEEDDIVILGAEQTPNGTGSGSKRPHDFPAVDQDELERQQKRTRIEETLASSSVNPNVVGSTIVAGSNMGATSLSTGTLPNTNTDLYSTSTIPYANPGSISPFPVLSPTEPWTPLPPSAYQHFLSPKALLQLTNNQSALADTDAGASQTASGSQAPVASGSGLKSGLNATPTAATNGSATAPAPGRANTRQTAAQGTRTRSGQATMAHSQGQPHSQPVPAWKVLDSMVPQRGSRTQAGVSVNAPNKMTKAADKSKGKEKKKTKAAKAKAQKEKGKGKEKERPKEVQTVDMNAEWSRNAAKIWPKKPLFGPYGEQLNGLHRTAVSSSTLLAAAGTAPPPSARVLRRMTESGRVTRLSASTAGIIEVPGTDSEPEFDDEDNVESSNSTYNPPRPHKNTQGSLSVPVRGRNPIGDDDDAVEIPAHLVQAKALELLVSLVTDSRTGTSGNPALAASVAALAASANVIVQSNSSGTAATPAAAGESFNNAVASSSKSTSQHAVAKPTPIPSWQLHAVFKNTTAPIPGRLSPVSAAAVSQFSNQCTQECTGFNDERSRRLPHPHNTMYPPIGHRGVARNAGAPYDFLPQAYLRYEEKLRELWEEQGKGEAVDEDSDGNIVVDTELLDRYQSLFQNVDLDGDANVDKNTDVGKDDEATADEKVALRLEDFEERFAEVKAELVAIVERLVILENKDVERAARELLEAETRVNAKMAGSASLAQAPVERETIDKEREVEVEMPQEKERDDEKEKEMEREPSGEAENMYVDDSVLKENVPSTGDVDMDTQMDLSSGKDSSHATQPTMTSDVSPEDASSSSTLVEKSKSSSPPPNLHISSTESIASSSGNSQNLNGDLQQGADHHSVSEADGSELTTVNVPGKDDMSTEGHAPVLTSSISLLVEELVHAKMLSVMDEMAQNKLKDTTMPADEPKAVENLTAPPSPSSHLQLQLQEPTADVVTLLAELRSLKAEFKDREQKDKEEKLAMRDLHSAEVDALRRRLSYLENRDPGPMAMAMHMPHRYYPPPFMPGEHGSPGDHHSHHMSAPPSGEYLDAERTRRQGFFPYGGYGRDAPYPEGDSGSPSGNVQSQDRVYRSASSVTPGPSEKGKSAQQQPSVETAPLPIKTQRKQHIMSFPRPKLP